MALFIQKIDSTQRRAISSWAICVQHIILSKTVFMVSALIGIVSLSACQSLPTAPISSNQTSTAQTSTVDSNHTDSYEDDSIDNIEDYNSADNYDNYDDDSDYPIEPYIPSEPVDVPDVVIERAPASSSIDDNRMPDPADDYEPIITPPPAEQPIPLPKLPSRSELLKQARQNSQQPTRQTTSSNVDLPAFRNLMQAGINQLRGQQLTAAENSFTRAQRLAPRSSAVYFYLSQVALKKRQPRKAEAMARRGLNVSQDASRHRALWQLILKSGQLQNNQRVVREAQQALR